MINKENCIKQLKACKDQLINNFGVSSMLLFGSVARNEQKESSDVDVFVEMKPNLLLLVEVKQFLEEKLGCTVDVIRNHRRIDSFFKQQIQKDGVEIFKSWDYFARSYEDRDRITNKQLLPTYPSIKWKQVMGVRDVIAHHYFDVDIDVIYQIIHDDLTPLLEAIRSFIKEMNE